MPGLFFISTGQPSSLRSQPTPSPSLAGRGVEEGARHPHNFRIPTPSPRPCAGVHREAEAGFEVPVQRGRHRGPRHKAGVTTYLPPNLSPNLNVDSPTTLHSPTPRPSPYSAATLTACASQISGSRTSIQSASARTCPAASRPIGVRLYSTCGGTTG